MIDEDEVRNRLVAKQTELLLQTRLKPTSKRRRPRPAPKQRTSNQQHLQAPGTQSRSSVCDPRDSDAVFKSSDPLFKWGVRRE
jgi:hypothetical protein